MKIHSHWLMILLLWLGAVFVAVGEDVIEQQPNGNINWSKGTVSAFGYGTAPENAPNAKKRLLARRAAQLDAYRNLAEMVNGVRVTSETVVKQMVAESDLVKTSIQSMVKGASMTTDHYQNEVATVVLTMSLDGRFMQMLTPEVVKRQRDNSFAFQLPHANDFFDYIRAIELPRISLFSRAHAIENAPGIEIQNARQLELVKQLAELLQQQNAQQVVIQLQQKIAAYENQGQFTGVIIDASEVNAFDLAAIPRLRDVNGRVLYPTLDDLRQKKINRRPVSYDYDLDDALRHQRVAVNPYVIKASSVYQSNTSDLVIDTQSAALLGSQQALIEALDNARVMVIVGKQ